MLTTLCTLFVASMGAHAFATLLASLGAAAIFGMAASQSIGASIKNQQQRLLRGQSRSKPDQIRQRHLWSSYCFHSTTGGAITTGKISANDYPIFTTPVGQNGQGYPSGLSLNLRDTNLPGVNRVSDQQNFSLWELGVSVMPLRQDVVTQDTTKMSQGDVNPEDLDLIVTNCVLQIVYLTNKITLGHAQDFPSPGGPSILAPVSQDYSLNSTAAQTGGGFGEGAAASPWDQRQARTARNAGAIPPAPALRRKFEVPIFLGAGDTFSFNFAFPRTVQLRKIAEGGTGGFHLRLDAWCVESFREQG